MTSPPRLCDCTDTDTQNGPGSPTAAFPHGSPPNEESSDCRIFHFSFYFTMVSKLVTSGIYVLQQILNWFFFFYFTLVSKLVTSGTYIFQQFLNLFFFFRLDVLSSLFLVAQIVNNLEHLLNQVLGHKRVLWSQPLLNLHEDLLVALGHGHGAV